MRLLVVIDGIVGGLSDRSVLAFGSGVGELTGLLLDRGARVTAIMSDPSEAASLRARASPRLVVVQGDVEAFAMACDVQSSRFDIALWIDTDVDALASGSVLAYLSSASNEAFVSVIASRDEVRPSGIWTKLDAVFLAAGLGWVAIQAPSLKSRAQNALGREDRDFREQLLVYVRPTQAAL